MAKMSKVELFINRATEAQWYDMREDREKAITASEKATFRKKYGFYPATIRPYETMHFIDRVNFELSQEKNAASSELRAENERLKLELEKYKAKCAAPAFCKMTGESKKATFYATSETLARFTKLIDKVEAVYGYKKYLAASFVMEEAMKRFEEIFEE